MKLTTTEFLQAAATGKLDVLFAISGSVIVEPATSEETASLKGFAASQRLQALLALPEEKQSHLPTGALLHPSVFQTLAARAEPTTLPTVAGGGLAAQASISPDNAAAPGGSRGAEVDNPMAGEPGNHSLSVLLARWDTLLGNAATSVPRGSSATPEQYEPRPPQPVSATTGVTAGAATTPVLGVRDIPSVGRSLGLYPWSPHIAAGVGVPLAPGLLGALQRSAQGLGSPGDVSARATPQSGASVQPSATPPVKTPSDAQPFGHLATFAPTFGEFRNGSQSTSAAVTFNPADPGALYATGGAAAGLAAGLIVTGLHSLHPAAGACVTLGFTVLGGVIGTGFGTGAFAKVAINPITGVVELTPSGLQPARG